MKKWQLYDVTNDTVIAESNEYMELDEMRNKLFENASLAGSTLIDDCFCKALYREDSSKGDLKGKWIICNEKSELFKKHKNKK